MLRRSNFRDLQVWQRGRSLSIELYKLTETFPDQEKFGITSQIRRAAVSIPTNIAEGHGRNSNIDFARFLYMSLGSVRELETLVEISNELDFVGEITGILGKLDELAKMIASLIVTLER